MGSVMWDTARRLDEYLRGRLRRALDELAAMEPDLLLSENVDILVAALLEMHMPKEISVDWGNPSRRPITEITTQIRDEFHRDQIHAVPASKVVVTFPISGTTEMLGYQASTFGVSRQRATISGGNVIVEVVERTLNTAAIQREIDAVKRDIDKRVDWANADLAKFQPTAEEAIRSAHANRKQRVLNDRALEDALGIPVRTSDAPRPPVPARRKQLTLRNRRAQAGFVPEPLLEEATYQDVLDVVRSWANSLERTPATASKLHEEHIRDLLLGTLNGYWEGAAGGELFNGSGKTDILIREHDRNVFIAECKIWRGPKAVAEALDQLLSYLVWRDSKAALVMFIRTGDPGATIEKLHSAVEGHPRHALTKDGADPKSRVDYILTADEEGRRVSLAVLPIVVRSDSISRVA